MSLEEAILDKVRRLPPAKQEEVLRFADGLQESSRARMVPSRDPTVGMRWIDLNHAAYADQWVAVEGDRLAAAGNDALKVFAAAQSYRRSCGARVGTGGSTGIAGFAISSDLWRIAVTATWAAPRAGWANL